MAKPCGYIVFATPEVAIWTENVVIPTLGGGILFKAEWVVYLTEYFIQQLLVCLPLLIQPFLKNIAVVDQNQQESDHYDAGC
jgi:hypothetical protein